MTRSSRSRSRGHGLPLPGHHLSEAEARRAFYRCSDDFWRGYHVIAGAPMPEWDRAIFDDDYILYTKCKRNFYANMKGKLSFTKYYDEYGDYAFFYNNMRHYAFHGDNRRYYHDDLDGFLKSEYTYYDDSYFTCESGFDKALEKNPRSLSQHYWRVQPIPTQCEFEDYVVRVRDPDTWYDYAYYDTEDEAYADFPHLPVQDTW